MFCKEYSNYQPRKAATGAEVNPVRTDFWAKWKKLRRIRDVAFPYLGKRAAGDEVYGWVPLGNEADKEIKPFGRFT